MSLRHKILNIAIAMLAVGCNTPTRLASFVGVDPKGWFSPKEILFTVEAADTLEVVDLQLLARYNKLVSTDKIEMMLSITSPDGTKWSEPYTLFLPAPSKSLEVISSTYRTNIHWRQLGEYSLRVTPMRSYQGVSAIGVEMVNRNENQENGKR